MRRIKLQTAWACAAIGAALAVVGCGGSTQVKTVTQNHTVTAAAATPAAATTSQATSSTTTTPVVAKKDCDSMGINAVDLKEGSCTEQGDHYTVVNSDSTLRLKTLSARLVGARAAESLSSPYSETQVAHGRFLIFTLTVFNRLDSPQTFDGVGTQQTALLLNKRSYTEDFDAENGPDQGSCIAKDDSEVQPGESTTCDVVFDVPAGSVGQLASVGNLVVSNFGADLSSDAVNAVHTLGIIRTYHPAVSLG